MGMVDVMEMASVLYNDFHPSIHPVMDTMISIDLNCDFLELYLVKHVLSIL